MKSVQAAFGLLFTSAFAWSSPQFEPDCPGCQTGQSCDVGEWSGVITPGIPTVGENTLWLHKEIAHVVVLPNEEPPQVLMWSLNNCGTTTAYTHTIADAKTYLWRADFPNDLTIKSFNTNGPCDPWILAKGSGTVWRIDAKLLLAGPSNYFPDCHPDTQVQPSGCPPITQPWLQLNGSDRAFQYDAISGSWSAAGNMDTEHWYPSAVVTGDGSILVVGHGNNPNLVFGSSHRERYAYTPPATYSWMPSIPNAIYGSSELLEISPYPHVHVLGRTGDLFLASGLESTPVGAFVPSRTAVLTLGTGGSTPLWYPVTHPSVEQRIVTNTAHFVYRQGERVHDSVYMVGGSRRIECINGIPAHTQVRRMVNPTAANQTWDTSLPPLQFARRASNTVILLDGSLLAVGGFGSDVDPTTGASCAGVYTPEIYRPSETFGTAASTAWEPMADMSIDRWEHSSAVLLPDGRVLIAGGKPGSHQTYLHYYTIELFEPPYLSPDLGDRPIVQSTDVGANGEWVAGSGWKDVGVTTHDQSTISKVALLGLGAATHNLDMGQRWVELNWNVSAVAGSGGAYVWSLNVQAPENWKIAPPGPYWLTVRDSCGRPSAGRLVYIR